MSRDNNVKIYIFILTGISLMFLWACGKAGNNGGKIQETSGIVEDVSLQNGSKNKKSNKNIKKNMSDTKANSKAEKHEDDEFIRVKDYIPNIKVDLKYATTDNFTSMVIYDFSDAYLRYGTVKKLKAVQELLAMDGYSIKIWDAFRPVAAQFKLWDIYPDPTYVANPNTGYSSHSRGSTVDITLVDSTGAELEMPTGFDDFSNKADRDYSDCDGLAARNAYYLETIMEKNGFKPYNGEWWHFSDINDYPVEKDFSPPATKE